jgi:hypothetical protein
MTEKSQSRVARFADSRNAVMKRVFGETNHDKISRTLSNMSNLLHFPYAPPLSQHGKTGWLLSYFLGEVPFAPITSDKPRRYGGVSLISLHLL